MKINVFNKASKTPHIEYGDILMCADGHDINHILIIDEGNLPASLNLDTFRIESTGDTLEELYGFISRGYDIKKIIKSKDVTLNIETEE